MRFLPTVGIAMALVVSGCTTKAELRRQQELDRIKQEVSASKTERADVDQQVDEMRTETQRLATLVDEQTALSRASVEEIKREIAALAARIQALEQRAVEDEVAARRAALAPVAEEKPKAAATLEAGKKLFDQGKFDEAGEVYRALVKKGGPDGKKAQYQLAETYFGAKDFASAALEYGEYKKLYPKDSLVPSAIFRQAQAFKSMGKSKEAKLFYQELVETHPKSQWAAKARGEIKKLR